MQEIRPVFHTFENSCLPFFAHAGLADGSMPVPGGVDLHDFPIDTYAGMPVCLVSHQLGADIHGTSGLLCGGIPETAERKSRKNLKHMFVCGMLRQWGISV